MPQPSIPYACARVSALSKGLLDQQTIKRMADGSLDEAMHTLLDVRYGNLPDATSADCDRMIDNTRTQTAAEIRAFAGMGADAVGMSTVPETMVCNYMGMKVLAVSCITNMATGIQTVKHSHARVLEIANQAGETLCRWLGAVIQKVE